MNLRFTIIIILGVLLIGIIYTNRIISVTSVFPIPYNNPVTRMQSTPSDKNKGIKIVTENLTIPWDIAFLPDGTMLVTERPGKLIKIGKEKNVIMEVPGVKHIGEGGLLGMVLHPDFASNHFLYFYLTSQDSGEITNRVERYIFVNDTLNDRVVILNGIRGSANHDGGRIAFGPDGYLYIATGDAENPVSAQDKISPNGKILRVKDDGSIPPDNPFGNAVYSMGHRNVQGLAWDANGFLWATEHGPSGSQTGNDEINRIARGGNYGWPVIKGSQTRSGFISPVIESGSADTWAPSGALFWDGSIFFTGLKGEALYEFPTNSETNQALRTYFKNEFGRIRTVILGPDGQFYLTTNNTDGRGKEKTGDDKIISVDPRMFRQK